MNAWTVIRVVLIGAIGYWTYFRDTYSTAPITLPWWSLALFLCLPPLVMPLIVAYWLAGDRFQLRRPSWRRNPFVGADPLQNAHLAAYCCLACGTIWLFYALTSSVRPSLGRAPLPIALFIAGVGCWLSVRLCLILFRSHLTT
jgi:hypothetical protein